MKRIETLVAFLKQKGIYPVPPVIESPHAPEVVVNGRKVLMFATNNYMGMTHDPRVVAAAIEGVKRWGIGNGSARLLTGNLEFHQILESKIAAFKGRAAALTFVSGYMANSGTIPALANVYKPTLRSFITGKTEKYRDTIIFSDEYNHASIVAGIKMSKAEKEIYCHRDMKDLSDRLKKYKKSQRKIIVSDGVFSMDGDIAPLPEILDLAKQYNALTYIDDAHATGILGPHGRGIEDYFGLEGNIDVVMGTFTKSFGGVGGFVVGSGAIIDYLKVSADTFIFTAPIAPPIVYGLCKAIDIVSQETWRRERVIANAASLRSKLQEHGFNTGTSETQIIPIIIGNEFKAIQTTKRLMERDILIPTAQWPAVPKGKARLRVTVSCEHTQDQIDHLVRELIKVRKEIHF